MDMTTLRIIGMFIGWAVLFAGIVGTYWKLRIQIKVIELKAKDHEEKLERIFKALKDEYLTKEKYTDMEETRSYKVKEHVSEEVGKLQEKMAETMTDVAEKFGKMFEDMKQTINGKV